MERSGEKSLNGSVAATTETHKRAAMVRLGHVPPHRQVIFRHHLQDTGEVGGCAIAVYERG
jgi:hypothetical protein